MRACDVSREKKKWRSLASVCVCVCVRMSDALVSDRSCLWRRLGLLRHSQCESLEGGRMRDGPVPDVCQTQQERQSRQVQQQRQPQHSV